MSFIIIKFIHSEDMKVKKADSHTDAHNHVHNTETGSLVDCHAYFGQWLPVWSIVVEVWTNIFSC